MKDVFFSEKFPGIYFEKFHKIKSEETFLNSMTVLFCRSCKTNSET